LRLSGAGLGILKGMGITFKNFLRPPITVQYPEQKLVMSRRIRGNEVLWYEGKCTGCATCAKACPQGNIEISTTPGPDNKRVVDVFRVDTGRCMFCGLCVESCPYDALFMGRNYERAKYRRMELVSEKEAVRMAGERQPSGYARPAIETGLPKQSLLVDWDKPDKDGGQHLDWLPFKRRKGGGK
jgi:NAD(P)H-quinone oxidoreductase subunit I